MTNRIDHTDCSHGATTKERSRCRTERRNQIKVCQDAYSAKEDGTLDLYEYYAMVEGLSYTLGVELREAYNIVEHGPVVV